MGLSKRVGSRLMDVRCNDHQRIKFGYQKISADPRLFQRKPAGKMKSPHHHFFHNHFSILSFQLQEVNARLKRLSLDFDFSIGGNSNLLQ